MNYAVIKSGGKQYRVSAGDVILVEKLLGESGSKITFNEVIMMGEGAKIHIEETELKTASVTGEVIEQTRGPKLLVFKKKRRQNYRRKKGHKQDLTAIRIKSIDLKKTSVKTTVKKSDSKADDKEKLVKKNKSVKIEAKTTVKKSATKKAAPKKVVKKAPKKE